MLLRVVWFETTSGLIWIVHNGGDRNMSSKPKSLSTDIILQ